MDTDNEEEELYSHRLREVFDSCDLDSKGYINRNEVIDLSQKLQCGDQVPELLRETLGDEFTDGKVTFDQFRDGFVSILAKTIDGLGDEITEEPSEISDFSFGDQYVPDLEKDATPTPPCTIQKGWTTSKLRKTHFSSEVGNLSLSKEEETLDGCGIINVFHEKCCNSAQESIVCGKATQIRQIWDEIAVGQSGSINLLQLSTICDHIGMEGMNGDDLEMLFGELDTDGDGLVSLEEFLSGLFGAQTPRGDLDCSFQHDDEVFDDDDLSTSTVTFEPCKKRKLPSSVTFNSPGRKKVVCGHGIHVASETLSSLNVDDFGCARLEDVKTYLKKCKVQDADTLFKDISTDGDGKVVMKDIQKYLGRILLDSGDALTKVLIRLFNDEETKMCGRLDSSSNEVSVLKNSMYKLENDNTSIMHEGEEQMRKEKEKYEQKYRKLEKSSQSKLVSKERDWVEEKEHLLESHRDEVVEMEVQMDQMRSDLLKTKDTLHDAITDNERLDTDLKSCNKELNLERKKFLRMDKELTNHKELKEKVTDLEGQLGDLSQVRYEETTRVKELERLTKELRDQNDEYITRLEAKDSVTGSENSSYLSEYFKSDINDLGDSYEGHSNDSDKRNAIIYEQEESINNLRRELDAVNRLLEDNNAMSNDRYNRELNYVTTKYEAEITDLQGEMEDERRQLNKLHSDEKEEMIENYESKIMELRKHLFFENQSVLKEEANKQQEGGALGADVGALEESYRTQLSKLEEKIIIIETEKAEMELNFLNQKAELEQNFRIERAELEQKFSSTSREADRSKKYIDFLKDDLSKKHVEFIEEMQRINKKEKQDSQERQQSRIEEINLKHQRELIEIRKTFNHQITEQEKAFSKERASLKEGFTREKSETEQKYLRERVELEDFLKQEYELEIANKLADLQKLSVEERAEIEESMRQEKYELSINLQHQKATAERNLRHVKTEMELKFTEERNQLIKDFEYEKNLLQNKYKREVTDLQQAFSGGEAGLKGKMKEDFTKLIEQRRKEWKDSFEKEKSDLLQSFAREKGCLEASWIDDKHRMVESFEEERKQLEDIFVKEKQELLERSQKQRQCLEDEFLEETKRLKETRDSDVEARIQRETENLRQHIDHLETELISLRQQKKELETRNQILELKQLSQHQEAVEISEFQIEKKQITHKIYDLTNSVVLLKADKTNLQNELEELGREKTTILDNSVMEITQQQEQIAQLQTEKQELQNKINQLGIVGDENVELKRETMRLAKECSDKERILQSLLEVEKANECLNERNRLLKMKIKSIEDRERQIQCDLDEKIMKLSRLEEEVQHYLGKIATLEAVHKKEMEAQKDRLNMQMGAANTERAKYIRELDDLKQQLHLSSLSSDRDTALKEKVFNDAKAEVIALNKKLEEKNRKIRGLEDNLKKLEVKKYKSSEEFQSLEGQVKNLKTLMNDRDVKTREERNSMLTKSIRSDTLVTDLYLENADLMKQIANAENSQTKAEKQVRQLTDQKRALQRVISKLCHANGISSEES